MVGSIFVSKSIKSRWMRNSIGTVLLVVVLAVSAFGAAFYGYYYSYVTNGLIEKARTSADFFEPESERNYLELAKDYVDFFEDKNRIEAQFLNSAGRLLYSSSERMPGIHLTTADVLDMRETGEISSWIGNDPDTDERILAVSNPITYHGTVIGAVRYVTALHKVDQQIAKVIFIGAAAGIFMLVVVYMSNKYFVRSIVEPVEKITDFSQRIAAGSYGVQLEKDHDDEIGTLVDSINDMSRKIQQSERMKSDFISSVSHELRTPLTAINGWAETLQSGELQDAVDVQKGLEIITSEARRLTNMVEELLEFSRIEDGRFTLSIEPTDVREELEDAVFTYRQFFLRENIELYYDEEDVDFPLIPGDEERLRQVFSNLLDNAAKHGGAGQRIDIGICMGYREEQERIVITIRDYGPGIPVEELPHVKYKFYKGSSKTRGSGIGLAVCDEIITRHGGTLTLGNAEGGGCVVTIALPTV